MPQIDPQIGTSHIPQGCPYCGTYFHTGLCPRVKTIDYYPNGTVKSVELHPVGVYWPSPEAEEGGAG